LIDILVIIILALAVLLHFTKKVPAKYMTITSAAASAATLALCLTALRLSATNYGYVLWPSRAATAGLKGGGHIDSLDGISLSNLGDFLAAALNRNELHIQAHGDFHRHYEPDTWKFWRALDSYDLEEASGGLALSPRRPILHAGTIFVKNQIPGHVAEPIRIVSAQGIETPTIEPFLRVLEPIPQGGAISFRVMRPTPDNGLQTIIYSPSESSGIDKDAPKQPDELGQLQLGLSGLPLVVRSSPDGGGGGGGVLHALGGKEIFGPAALSAAIADSPSEWQRTYPAGADVCLFPRLTLLPHLYEHYWTTWLVGIPSTYLRQFLALPKIFDVFIWWDIIPKQYYLLDDGLTFYSFAFRLSSLAASLALAFLLWSSCMQFKHAARLVKRRRYSCVLILTILFQLADLMCFRRF